MSVEVYAKAFHCIVFYHNSLLYELLIFNGIFPLMKPVIRYKVKTLMQYDHHHSTKKSSIST